MRPICLFCVVLCGGCGGPSPEPVARPRVASEEQPSALSAAGAESIDPEAVRELARLNQWCGGVDDACRVHELPGEYPGMVDSGEVAGFVESAKQRIEALGWHLCWNDGSRSFVLERMNVPTDGEIARSIRLIVGGMFSPDHLGPGPYERTIARARDHAGRYLDRFVQDYVDHVQEPRALSNLYLPTMLSLVAEQEPDRVRAVAQRLSTVYQQALGSLPEDAEPNLRAGLETRRDELVLLSR